MTPPGRTAVTLPARGTPTGVGLALISAVSFGTSGTLARGLLDSGWSPGAATLIRVALAAAVVAPLGVVALRGRWAVLRRNLSLVTAYGVLAVAGAQFCYFSAVQHMQVGPALLIEYTAPAAVVCWIWLRQGQRPSALTALGAVVAALGLVLVLGLLGGVRVDPTGALWALGAMVGAAAYFIISGDGRTGLPGWTLAGGGLAVGAVVLAVLGLVGVLPIAASNAPAVYGGHSVPVWLPVLGLGFVSAALAYTSGIAAARRLGSRLASFVALIEVLAAVLIAWAVLGEVPLPVQLLGGGLIVAGVIVVRLGEPAVALRGRLGPATRPTRRR